MLTRHQIADALREQLARQDYIRTAWLGGSDATGRADEMSDVDLCLIVEKGRLEDAAEAIDAVLRSLSPIRAKYRMPFPTWHGFHQAFYQLADAHEHTMVDWVILEVGQAHPWFEVERHGVPRVLFDKDGLVKPAHVDRAAIGAAVAKKVEDLRAKFVLFRHLPAKLVDRGLPVDAAHFYFALILRPLVDLLRCVHCPDRHDYGFRYVRDDLPREEYEALERLSRWGSAAELRANAVEACGRFERVMAEWDRRSGRSAAQRDPVL
jgi:hypothetical protein